MTGQTKAGHIGHGVYPFQCGQIGAWRVEQGGHGQHLRIAGSVQFFFLECRRQNAHAQRLAQHQSVAHPRVRIALDAFRMHQAQRHQAINRLHRINGVATSNWDTGSAANRGATFENAADGGGGQYIDRHAHQRQRQNGPPAHGVYIRYGVGGGNAAKVKRVVDDRHEEIGGGDQRLLFVELVHRRVI